LLGLEEVGWTDVPVLLAETAGADCFNAALRAGKLVSLDSITSVAKSLGALTVSKKLFDLATLPSVSDSLKKKFEVVSRVVTDRDAVRACLSFADDHR
jgi:L-serine/L-threonine ammonia-lyase